MIQNGSTGFACGNLPKREVKAAAELTHWNTIDIFDYGFTEDGRFYYVMAFLNGLNLEDLVTQFGPIEPGRVIHFLSQACDAADQARQRTDTS